MESIQSFADNLFIKGYLIDTQNRALSKNQKRKYLITSICIGVLSLGLAHLLTFIFVYGYLKNKYSIKPQPNQEGKVFKQWKKTHFVRSKDLKFEKPKFEKTDKQTHVEAYKKSVQAMESAMADTCMSYVVDGGEEGLMPIVNTLTFRYKNILEGYIAVKYPNADQKEKLYELMRQLFENGSSGCGSIGGSPLAILNLVDGKQDGETDPQALFRNKLYFMYKLNQFTNEVMASKELQEGINAWLDANDKGWQLETALIRELNHHVPFFFKSKPIFWYGTQARQNYTHFIRSGLSPSKVQKKHETDPNHTFAEAEKLAEEAEAGELEKRFRTKFSPQEVFLYTGELEESAEKSAYRKEVMPRTAQVADTSFAESVLDYKKRTQRIPWIPGKHYYNVGNGWRFFTYNRMVQDLHLPAIAGVSGTVDQSFTMAGIVGFHSKEDLMKIRMIYLAWMISSDDHSFHEIMQSSKTYGLDYTPGPSSYMQVKPNDPEFIRRLREAQAKRGCLLPDEHTVKKS